MRRRGVAPMLSAGWVQVWRDELHEMLHAAWDAWRPTSTWRPAVCCE